MLDLKSCPRCRGDMHTNRDMYGPYKECLQCGFVEDLPRSNGLMSVPLSSVKKKKVA